MHQEGIELHDIAPAGAGPLIVEDARRDDLVLRAAGALVVLESTTYPGTTDELMRPILEQSGLKLTAATDMTDGAKKAVAA